MSEGSRLPFRGLATLVVDDQVVSEDARVDQHRFRVTPRQGASCEPAYGLRVISEAYDADAELVSPVPLHEGQRIPLPERRPLNARGDVAVGGLFGGEARIVTLGDYELVLEIEGAVWCDQPADLDEDPSPCEPVGLARLSVTYAFDGPGDLEIEDACAEPIDAWTEVWDEPLCAVGALEVCEGKGADAG